MTEVTLNQLNDLAEDYIREVGRKRELIGKVFLTTRKGQNNTFNVTLLANEPVGVQLAIHLLMAAKQYDQIVCVIESVGYMMHKISTAEIMRITEGKAETTSELSQLIMNGVVSHEIIPAKYKVTIIHLTGESKREEATSFRMFKVEGEGPNRQIIPIEDIWDESFNQLLPLIPPAVEDMTFEQRRHLGMAGLRMLHDPHVTMVEYNNLDPDLKREAVEVDETGSHRDTEEQGFMFL